MAGPKAKLRLDQLVVETGLAPSRARAQALIIAGQVYQETLRLDKPGQQMRPDAVIHIKGADHPYVSRGGLKLAHALDHFGIEIAGLTALDLGSSTGGFVDVLLLRGAAKIFAVDVGHGQLAWKLRQDPRVIVKERCNARYLMRSDIPAPIDLITADLSFISLTIALPAALALANANGRLIALIKPQFEVGKGDVGKGGIVRDPALHHATIEKISAWLEKVQGWRIEGVIPSPITGADGNHEFLLSAQNFAQDQRKNSV